MHIFKRALAVILALAMILSLCACGKEPDIELDFFAPNQSVGIVSTIVNSYHSVKPNVTIRITYDEGAMLAAKIEAGYECDIYLADDTYFLDWLDSAETAGVNVNHNDRIYSDSRQTILTGPVYEAYAQEGQTTTDYSIAVVKPSQKRAAADAFIEYFLSEVNDSVFEEWGFTRYTPAQ